MRTANRVLVNTLALYVNMGVTMGVTLLATRFALLALGEAAYGVYMLVANITAMLSVLNVAMAGATQRFLSYSLGAAGEGKTLGQIFYTSIVLHLIIAVVLCAAILLLGGLGIAYVLDIPAPLTHAAYVVLAGLAASIVFSVVSVPYEAAMNAHEDIYQIAGINIIDASLKMLATGVLFLFEEDRLQIYALLIMCAGGTTYLLKRSFSRRHYTECNYRFGQMPPHETLRRIVGYAGWNLLGNGASIFRYQGTAIVLNMFFGVVVNAAYGVAQQVNAFMMFFANSIIRPLRPLVMKAEGSGDRERMLRLAFSMTRLTLLMMALAVTPLYINMPFVLKLWLTDVPSYAIDFCRLFLLVTLVLQAGMGLITAIESEGHIKWLNLCAGFMHFIPIPAGYLLLRAGYAPPVILIAVLAEEILTTFIRLYLARRQTGLSARDFLFRLTLPASGALAAAFGITWVLAGALPEGFIRLTVSAFAHTFFALLLFYPVLSPWERHKIADLWKSATRKIPRRH